MMVINDRNTKFGGCVGVSAVEKPAEWAGWNNRGQVSRREAQREG